jgi:membrane-associated phospholipid phosphatase
MMSKVAIILILLMLAISPLASCKSAVLSREPTGGQWKTIILESGDSIRSVPPPAHGSKQANDEIEELKDLQLKRTPEMVKAAKYWDQGASVRWNEIARDLVIKYKTDPPMASRVYALLSVAQYDSLVATWNNKYYYNRSSPREIDQDIYALFPASIDPSYPSEHAAVAAASAQVLKYLYPNESEFLDGKVKEQEESRLQAGMNFRSDVDAGDQVGKAVAEKVIDKARADGFDTAWDGVMPKGSIYWTGTNPTRPTWGKVKSWLIGNVTLLRPPPPPMPGSKEFEVALSEVRKMSENHNKLYELVARRWADGAGTYTPPGHWNEIASKLIQDHGMSELKSARTLALMNMAVMDAGICCWDAKYHYWLLRPWQADPNITASIGKPNFPSYTSGHSAFSSAASTFLAYVFPDEKGWLRATADEAGISRLYGCIHYRFDIEQGAAQGRKVGEMAIQRGMNDGSS